MTITTDFPKVIEIDDNERRYLANNMGSFLFDEMCMDKAIVFDDALKSYDEEYWQQIRRTLWARMMGSVEVLPILSLPELHVLVLAYTHGWTSALPLRFIDLRLKLIALDPAIEEVMPILNGAKDWSQT